MFPYTILCYIINEFVLDNTILFQPQVLIKILKSMINVKPRYFIHIYNICNYNFQCLSVFQLC